MICKNITLPNGTRIKQVGRIWQVTWEARTIHEGTFTKAWEHAVSIERILRKGKHKPRKGK